MVEGCSYKQGQGGLQWLACRAAGSPSVVSCASNHRSTPFFERARRGGRRPPRPAAQVQR